MSKAATGKGVKCAINPGKPPALGMAAKEWLDQIGDADIDVSDIPELSPKFWKGLAPAAGKSQATLRADRDILECFFAATALVISLASTACCAPTCTCTLTD